jgi:hypothetical protein
VLSLRVAKASVNRSLADTHGVRPFRSSDTRLRDGRTWAEAEAPGIRFVDDPSRRSQSLSAFGTTDGGGAAPPISAKRRREQPGARSTQGRTATTTWFGGCSITTGHDLVDPHRAHAGA